MRGLYIDNAGLQIPKFTEHRELFKEAFARRGAELCCATNEEKISGNYDFCLFYDKDVALCRFLEKRMPVFNSSRAIAVCDDKGLTAAELSHLPMPKQIVSPLIYSGSLSEGFLLRVGEELGFPLVVKAAKGSFGAQVTLVRSREELFAQAKRAGTSSLVFQEYVEANGEDIRLYVAGERIFAGLKRKAAKGDFRANLSVGGSMTPYEPTAREAELAIEACRAVGASFAGVDLIGGARPLILEVNSNAHFKNLLLGTGRNYADAVADYILKSV